MEDKSNSAAWNNLYLMEKLLVKSLPEMWEDDKDWEKMQPSGVCVHDLDSIDDYWAKVRVAVC